MCCAAFIAKYVLFFANFVFSLAGLTIIGLGIAVLVQLSDLQDILPVNVIPISLIVLGAVIFLIAFLACCGAIRESRCMLITYSICMALLAGAKIYLSVVVFNFLSDIQSTVSGWINSAFANINLRGAFHAMEALFSCCGTVGPSSYENILPALPPTCCANPVDNICQAPDAFSGCSTVVTDYFDTFGEAIGSVIIVVIVVEVVAIVLAWFLSYSISSKRGNIA